MGPYGSGQAMSDTFIATLKLLDAVLVTLVPGHHLRFQDRSWVPRYVVATARLAMSSKGPSD